MTISSSQLMGALGVGKTDYSVSTSGIYANGLNNLAFAPTSASTAIAVAGGGKVTFTGSADVTGAGHSVGSLGWGVMNASGKTVAMMIGAEGKIDVTAGTVTTAVASENQLATNAGTIGSLILTDNQVVANSGTITTAIGTRNTITANSGTITTYYGVLQPDLSGIIPSAARWSFYSQDTAAPLYNRSSIVDASQYAQVPTTGQTITMPAAYLFLILIPAGTLATLTIDLPTAPIDGQEITVKSTQQITSLTLNAGGGKSVVDSITSLTAMGYFRIKYLSTSSIWYRIG